MIEAILLVGGQGTRLRPLTISTPKPMLPVAGFPCTEHQIAIAREAGIGRVILGTSYRAEVFEEYLIKDPLEDLEKELESLALEDKDYKLKDIYFKNFNPKPVPDKLFF